MPLTDEQKRIWFEWRRMHFHVQTLATSLDNMDTYSEKWTATTRELDELNAQMADLEDVYDPWLTELITNEF